MVESIQSDPDSVEVSAEVGGPLNAGGIVGGLLRSDVISILGVVVIVAVGMTILFPGFGSSFNRSELLATIAVTSIVGMSQLSVLAVGQFNLALPAMGALTGMLVAWLLQIAGLNWPVAVVLALAFAAFLGFIQGVFVAVLKLNPFIVTLGLASAYTGVMFVVLGDERFQKIGTALPTFGRGSIATVPNIFIVSMLVCLLVGIFIRFSVPGRHLMATGANPVAARFSALPVNRTMIAAHSMSGALAGVAAIFVVSRLAVGSPAIGQDWLLTSFAAPVLSGTLLSGGKVSVLGTILGATLLAIVANALVIVGVNQYWYQTGLGIIILGAVSLDQLRGRLLASSRQ